MIKYKKKLTFISEVFLDFYLLLQSRLVRIIYIITSLAGSALGTSIYSKGIIQTDLIVYTRAEDYFR